MIRKRSSILFCTAAIVIILCLSGGAGLAQRDRFGASRPSPVPNADTSAGSRRDQRTQALRARMAPWLGIKVEDPAQNARVKGVRVLRIQPDSPADKAGLRPEDIITGLAGKLVASGQQLTEITAGLTIGTDYQIEILRGGSAMNLAIRPTGTPVAASSSGGGGGEVITDEPAPRKGPLDINTLKYAFIDPKTHNVTFVGAYDPAYNTGPIPYDDYLKTALENAYPSFSLEPGPEQQAEFDRMDKAVSADISRMQDADYCNQWGQRLVNLLIHDDSLSVDSKRFFQNMGSGMGITGEELSRVLDAASGKIEMSSNELFTSCAKMMRGIGAPVAADGLMALANGGSGPEEIMQNMANAMGLGTQYDELNSKYRSGSLSLEQFRPEEIILCMSELCRQFEVPANDIANTASRVRSGESADLMFDLMSNGMSNFIVNKAGSRMVNGLVLGPEVMARMYNLPVPRALLVYKNLASDSLLSDVLFKSDYRLKSIGAYPDAREKVPAHLTTLEFIQKEAQASSYYVPADTGAMLGNRLVPADVKMRVSPNGDIVQFQDSQVKVISWVMRTVGNDSRADDFIRTVVPKYGDFLTQHYDEYARVYPEWHKMSEAAKIVALVRWAKKNNYAINVTGASDTKVQHPASVEGFWSAVFQVDGDKTSLTVVQEGGASFGQGEGEDWVQAQPDVEVTSDVLKQLAASAVLAKQSVNAAVSGDMEAARDLAGKSALAMTGEIDLTQLPTLDGVPSPSDPASYAAATSEVIDQASDCLNQMKTAQKDLQHASEIAATSPEEAKKITEQATRTQDEAQAKLKQIMDGISAYTSNPSQAGDVAVALHSGTGIVMPIGGNTPPSTTTTPSTQNTATTQAAPQEDWSAMCSKWITELDQVDKQIESTRQVLLKLNASIQSDKKLFDQWEADANDGFDRCVKMAADQAIDFGAGALSERYDTIYELAKKLPGKPDDVIEKYRLMASLAHRLKEAKATNDFAGLAASEGKTDTEIYETMRDGIGQVISLLGLEDTIPVLVAWRYTSQAFDMAYNLTELRQLWKNVSVLEANNERYAEAVKKLTVRMQELVAKQKELKRKIEAGEPVDFSSSN